MFSNKSIDKATSKIYESLDAIILNASSTLFVPKEKFKKLTPLLFEKYVKKLILYPNIEFFFKLNSKLNKNSNIIMISSIASKNGMEVMLHTLHQRQL